MCTSCPSPTSPAPPPRSSSKNTERELGPKTLRSSRRQAQQTLARDNYRLIISKEASDADGRRLPSGAKHSGAARKKKTAKAQVKEAGGRESGWRSTKGMKRRSGGLVVPRGERSGVERSGGSHHVRLYSQTKSAALRAIPHCVTFSPSPWFFGASCAAARVACAASNCFWD